MANWDATTDKRDAGHELGYPYVNGGSYSSKQREYEWEWKSFGVPERPVGTIKLRKFWF